MIEEIKAMADIYAKCIRRNVACLIQTGTNEGVIGFNHTPDGARDCGDGGCPRCENPDVKSFQDYEFCSCVHAEINTITAAAKQGISLRYGIAWCTLRPCIKCLTALLQSGVEELTIGEWWRPKENTQKWEDLWWDLAQGFQVLDLSQSNRREFPPVLDEVSKQLSYDAKRLVFMPPVYDWGAPPSYKI